MRIYFSRHQEQSRKYVHGFWAAIVVGAIATIAANPHGFGLGAFLLALAFVALCAYMGAKVKDDYADQEFRARELGGEEYMALDSRLKTYPELKEKVGALLQGSDRITYARAYELEEVVNAHADKMTAQQDAESQQRNRQAVFESVGQNARAEG